MNIPNLTGGASAAGGGRSSADNSITVNGAGLPQVPVSPFANRFFSDNSRSDIDLNNYLLIAVAGVVLWAILKRK